jgi:hypothetical protein
MVERKAGMRNAGRVQAEKPEGTRPRSRYTPISEDNLKMDHKEVG